MGMTGSVVARVRVVVTVGGVCVGLWWLNVEVVVELGRGAGGVSCGIR